MDDSMQLLSTVEETSKNACRGPVFSHLPVRRCSYLERALACGFGLQSRHGQKPPKCCLVSYVLLEEAWGEMTVMTLAYICMVLIKFFHMHDLSWSSQKLCRLAGQFTMLPFYR